MEIFNRNKGLLYWLIIALIASITYLSWVSITTINDQSDRTMSFAGSGEVEVKPDTATININIEEKGKTQTESENKMVQKANTIINKLKEFGIEDKDIKTENIYSNKEYDYSKQPYTLIGFSSSETLKIKILNTENIEKIKSAISEHGVNIYGLDWSIENIEKYKQEAREKAIVDAKEKAKNLSKDLGIKIGKIVDFNESYIDGGNDMYPMMYKMEMAAGSSGPNNSIQEGVNKVKVNVNVTFTIK